MLSKYLLTTLIYYSFENVHLQTVVYVCICVCMYIYIYIYIYYRINQHGKQIPKDIILMIF